jgi:hypothetical protein
MAARRFKAGWTELGRLLCQVRDQGSYEEWGYESFEAYCKSELHIRESTALKLTRSFSFLAKHEPSRSNESFDGRAPPFEVIEVLANAEERGQLSPSEYRKVRDSIWEPDRSPAELRRELSEQFPAPPKPKPADSVRLRRLAATARRLAEELLDCDPVPRAVGERAERLASDLEGLVSRVTADSKVAHS